MKQVHRFNWLAAAVFVFSLVFISGSNGVAQAELKLSPVFGDNMVLQRDKEVPVWGTAKPGTKVNVEFAGQTATATAEKDGRWMARLQPLSAGGPHDMQVAGDGSVAFENVLVGEVWVCSGQSNMEWPLNKANNPESEIAAADDPKLRLLAVKRKRSDKEDTSFEGQWQACTPQSAAGFSAVAYFFGRHLRQELDIPIGLVKSAWGGTPAEHWTPKSSYDADPTLVETSAGGEGVMKQSSSLYNGMIAPLVPMAIQGVIWYQGESNVPRGPYYRHLFSSMIEGWRNEWQQGDFPFLFVQIAPYNYKGHKGCPLVREAQLQTLSVPNTGMVVTMDIATIDDIHPRNKQDVGKRLGLAARAIAYGEDIAFSGPIYKSMEVKGDKVVLSFDHTNGGLVAVDGPLNSFEIAGESGEYVPATAEIEGDTVVVHSDEVKQPTEVRFAWKDTALPNLFNGEKLPASPFRTFAK